MLVRSIDEIKTYSPSVGKNMTWSVFLPAVKQAELLYVIPVIGKELYQELDTALDATPSPEQAALLEWVQPMTALFAVYHIIPTIRTITTDMGIMQQSSGNGTSTPADNTKVLDLLYNTWRTACNYREVAYKHLQENQGDYPTWVSSNAYTIFNRMLVRSNAELEQNVAMCGSVNTFLSLKTFLLMAESKYVKPITCLDLLQDIKQKNASNTLTLSSLEKELLPLMQAVASWGALYEAIPSLKATVIDGTLVTAIPAESSKIYATLTIQETNEIRRDALEKLEYARNELRTFLLENVEAIQLYETSTCYTSQQAKTKLPDNNGKPSFQFP